MANTEALQVGDTIITPSHKTRVITEIELAGSWEEIAAATKSVDRWSLSFDWAYTRRAQDDGTLFGSVIRYKLSDLKKI